MLPIATVLAIPASAAQDSTQPTAPAPASPPVAATATPSPLCGLELAWKIDLPPNRLVGGIASDPEKGVAYALAPANKAGEFDRCLQISADGKIEREFTIKGGNIVLRVARLRRDATRDLLSFTQWTSKLYALDTNGNVLWTYPSGQGINDVWPADLDGDGLDEVVIGFNGFTGVHVLDSRGNKLWESQHIGNVWRVGAVDLDGDGASEVITGSEKGAIAAFKRDGTRLPDIALPTGYSTYLRPVKLSETDKSEGILLFRNEDDRVAVMKSNGQLAWELGLPRDVTPNGEEFARGKPWLALLNLSIVVIDTSTGTVIAQTNEVSRKPECCWLLPKEKDTPLLLRSTQSGIDAFRVIRSTD